MSERQDQYTYTADRKAFLSNVSGWAMLFFLEGSVVSILIVIFAPGAPLMACLVAVLIGGVLYMVLAHLCAPLWTRHSLYPDGLDLHYGRDTLSVPRTNIASAERFAASTRMSRSRSLS